MCRARKNAGILLQSRQHRNTLSVTCISQKREIVHITSFGCVEGIKTW